MAKTTTSAPSTTGAGSLLTRTRYLPLISEQRSSLISATATSSGDTTPRAIVALSIASPMNPQPISPSFMPSPWARARDGGRRWHGRCAPSSRPRRSRSRSPPSCPWRAPAGRWHRAVRGAPETPAVPPPDGRPAARPSSDPGARGAARRRSARRGVPRPAGGRRTSWLHRRRSLRAEWAPYASPARSSPSRAVPNRRRAAYQRAAPPRPPCCAAGDRPGASARRGARPEAPRFSVPPPGRGFRRSPGCPPRSLRRWRRVAASSTPRSAGRLTVPDRRAAPPRRSAPAARRRAPPQRRRSQRLAGVLAGSGRGLRPCEAQAHGDRRAGPGRAGDVDLAAVGVDDFARDRQAEAGAAHLPRAHLVHTVEAVEDAFDVLGADADAGVADADHSSVAITTVHQLHGPRARVLHGIVEQDQDDLAHALLVGVGPERSLDVGPKLEAGVPGECRAGVRGGLHRVGEVDGRELERDALLVAACEHQQVVEEARHVRCFGGDVGDRFVFGPLDRE